MRRCSAAATTSPTSTRARTCSRPSAGNNPGQSQGLLLSPGARVPCRHAEPADSAPAVRRFAAAYREDIPQSEFTFGATGLNAMSPDLKMGAVQAWNFGVQRLIAKNTVLEVRYVGNRRSNVWHTFNLNEVNIFENGFVDEFKRAQQNMAINVANGLTGLRQQRAWPANAHCRSSRRRSAPAGHSRRSPANQGFTNDGFITNLQQGKPARLATSHRNNQIYFCRMVGSNFSPCISGGRNFNAPGPYAINCSTLNPYAIGGNLNIVDDDSETEYHAMQVQLRRRYTDGLTANVNYTLGKITGRTSGRTTRRSRTATGRCANRRWTWAGAARRPARPPGLQHL